MRLIKNYLICGFIGFITGIILQIKISNELLIIAAVLSILLLLWKRRFFYFSFLILGIIIAGIYVNWWRQNISLGVDYDSVKKYSVRIEKPAWESPQGLAGATIIDISKKVLIKEDFKTAGTIIETTGKVVRFEAKEEFDAPNYWLTKGIVGELKSNSEIIFITNKPTWQNSIENFRGGVITKVENYYNYPYGELANGLILGYRADFNNEFKNQMSRSGTTHIVAISGYNVAIVVAIFFYALLGLGLTGAYWLTFLAVIVFVILTGAEPSVVRAGILILFVLQAKVLGRRQDSGYLLLLVAFVMLLNNPSLARYSLGFQLSFIATAGLMYISPLFERSKIIQKLPLVLRETVVATLSAQIAVFPLLLYSFNTVSIIAIVANVLILPIVPLTMLIIFLGFIGALMHPILAILMASGAELLLRWLVGVIRYFGNFKPLEYQLSIVWLILSYLVMIGIVIIINKKYETDQ